MKRIMCLALVFVMAAVSAFGDIISMDTVTATDEELAQAAEAIKAEQKSRIKASLTLTDGVHTIQKGDTLQLTATLEALPDDLENTAPTWESSNA